MTKQLSSHGEIIIGFSILNVKIAIFFLPRHELIMSNKKGWNGSLEIQLVSYFLVKESDS